LAYVSLRSYSNGVFREMAVPNQSPLDRGATTLLISDTVLRKLRKLRQSNAVGVGGGDLNTVTVEVKVKVQSPKSKVQNKKPLHREINS